MNMYDKLGSLLNETLEAGAVKFVRVESPCKESASAEEKNAPEKEKTKEYVYKKLTPELEHAYKVLNVPLTATKDDIKRAYKERLLYYHPDKHTGNAVIEKVANKKTSEIIQAYNLLDDFLQQ